ncbi:MAG TPA: TylF/MycF/NovP-related O-methyltransferase [Tepidisphaeraceae bacterium]|jgi:hypothetical protein
MPSAADRYLELLKKSLLNELYIENEARLIYMLLCIISRQVVEEEVIRDISRLRPEMVEQIRKARREGTPAFTWKIPAEGGGTQAVNLRDVTEFYHTMIGRPRIDNIHQLLNRVVSEGVAGDLIETGVWRGGATIFMRGFLAAHDIGERNVWVADSFAGLPDPTLPEDQGIDFSADVHPILAISKEEVADLFARYDLLDDRVKFLEGWFKDTLPAAPIEKLALMRLDGDLYESTRDALVNLYDRLSPGGFVIIDDYGDFEGCRRAVDEFRQQRDITSTLTKIDWSAVWWQK